MKTVLCFGDSNTYGYNPVTHQRFGYDIRWTGIIDEKLRKHGIRVAEEGLCGRTTIFPDELRRNRKGVNVLPFLLETHSPDFVVIMLGTNDCKVRFHASAYLIGKGIKQLIGQIKSVSDAKVLLISPIHLADGVGEPDFDPEFNEESVSVSRQLKKVFSGIAKEEDCLFLAASDYADPSPADREHLDCEGHRLLADAVFNVIYDSLSA